MQQKFLKIGSLALLQIAIVGNLQILPANASYGAALPFLYVCAVLGFFLPCTLMVAELATTRPQTGGAYIWCEQAFGSKTGFFVVCILWISNLLWYPSIFSLVAANFAYLFDVSLAQNKMFVVGFGIILFWLFTGLNCIGIKFSSRTSMICSIVGIITPMIIIIVGGIIWCTSGKSLAISFNRGSLIPDISHMNNIGLLIAVVISLFGIEITAVHAGNVVNPKRNFPRSLFISSITVLILLLLSELSISAIIPAEKLNVVTGVLDTIVILFQEMHLSHFISIILLLVLMGNIGSIAAWMLGSTRGMYVACQKNHVAEFLQKTNQYESPIGILIFEAIIFTIVSMIFLLFPRLTDSFWLLLDLASQVTLIYYIILFMSAIRLRYLPVFSKGFVIPGGNVVLCIIMLIGAFTSFGALCAGFIPPGNLDKSSAFLFRLVMSAGPIVTIALPFILLLYKKSVEIKL
jgi:glutamate:GABA antiporter